LTIHQKFSNALGSVEVSTEAGNKKEEIEEKCQWFPLVYYPSASSLTNLP
jgi:hypothetical protein